MEEILDRTDFWAYRLPIISASAIEERFDRLEPDEVAQLELLKKSIRLKDEDF